MCPSYCSCYCYSCWLLIFAALVFPNINGIRKYQCTKFLKNKILPDGTLYETDLISSDEVCWTTMFSFAKANRFLLLLISISKKSLTKKIGKYLEREFVSGERKKALGTFKPEKYLKWIFQTRKMGKLLEFNRKMFPRPKLSGHFLKPLQCFYNQHYSKIAFLEKTIQTTIVVLVRYAFSL